MPVTPEEAKTFRSSAIDATEHAAQVARIDRYLSTTAPTEMGEWYCNIDNVSRPVIDKLVADYRDAGWDVVITHDRDGTALVFRDSGR